MITIDFEDGTRVEYKGNAKIVEYRSINDIDVKLPNGTIREHVSFTDFLNENI